MPKNPRLTSVFQPFIFCVAAALAGCATPGVDAAVHRDPARLQRVLEKPNHGGERLDELLANSVAFDCAECVKLVLDKGAKPDASLLSAAALSGHAQVANLLMDAGADPEAAMTSIHGQTRKWIGGCCLSPEQAQGASDFFKKIERERASRPGAAARAEPAAPPSAPVAAPAPPGSRVIPSFQQAERPDDYAVVVGLEKYDDLPSAAYAERDAAAAADFLKALGVPARNVAALTGSHATRSGLAKHVEGWLADNAGANSTVYFYFAGRGAPDPKSGQAYLVPFDGDPAYLEQTAYPLKRLYEKLGALKAKRVIVLLDTDFSGAGGRSTLAKGAQAPTVGVDTGFNSADGKIALLTAADADQLSGTNEEKGYGLFTYYFLNGLNGAAKDASGQVTLKSLFGYIKTNVMSDARRAGRGQIPQFRSGGTETDDVILRGKQAQPAP